MKAVKLYNLPASPEFDLMLIVDLEIVNKRIKQMNDRRRKKAK